MRSKPQINHQELENLSSRSTSPFKKRGRPKKSMPFHSIQAEKNLPKSIGNILTPQIIICPPIVRKRVINPFPSGYHRLETVPFPEINFIELTQIDLDFIEENKEKYRFYDFYLLNSHRLVKVYSLFSKKCGNVKKKDHLIHFLQQKLLVQEEEPIFHLFLLVKQQKPRLFEEFTSVLAERWIFRNKIGNLFQVNQPEKLEDVEPYSAREKFKKLPLSTNPWRMQNYLLKHMKKSLVFLKKYEEFRKDHLSRKNEFLNIMMQFLRNLVTVKTKINVQSLPDDPEDLNLLDINQKLRILIEGVQKNKKVEKEKKTQRKSKSASRRILNTPS